MNGSLKLGFGCCCLVGVIISVVIGIAVGLLFAFGFIPNIVTSVWIAFGLSVFTLIVLITAMLVAACCESDALKKCLRKNVLCLLVGIIGTLVTALVALSITLITSSIIVAIIMGLGAFFASLMLIALISFILCVVGNLCSFGRFVISGKE